MITGDVYVEILGDFRSAVLVLGVDSVRAAVLWRVTTRGVPSIVRRGLRFDSVRGSRSVVRFDSSEQAVVSKVANRFAFWDSARSTKATPGNLCPPGSGDVQSGPGDPGRLRNQDRGSR
jgi:hypothetical protein